MEAGEFVRKWRGNTLGERQASQSHFLDLCALLDVPPPTDPDRYCFERGMERVGGGQGWADVWRKGCFGWEYKGPHANLAAALRQLQTYALDLENPPYLVVSDMERIEVHTNWTNTVSATYRFALDDLYNPERRADLKSVLDGGERLRPGIDRRELTAKAAQAFGELSRRLQEERGNAPRAVAHFLNRLVFCMFAEDAGLLPRTLFTRTVQATTGFPDAAERQLQSLFETMRTGGFFGPDVIHWFNGGLFDDAATIRLELGDLKIVADLAAEHDWSEIDPAIFGTLFEQALKATRERPALGAHYTDREKILKIVGPVVVRPLTAEWEAARGEIGTLMAEAKSAEAEAVALGAQARKLVEQAGRGARGLTGLATDLDQKALAKLRAAQRQHDLAASQARIRARGRLEAFQNRLAGFRVLDPACGSGNFLYVALHALRDIEQKAVLDAQLLGLPAPPLRVGVDAVAGIEIDAYAAELARVTLWIGNLQWLIRRGYGDALREPLLSSLDQIENRDAVLNPDGTEAEWPAVDVIIGNPPFLGDKKMVSDLGSPYVSQLRRAYDGRVPGGADFVCFWFAKAWQQVNACKAARVGLVATNSIRGGANRRVVDPIASAHAIYEAWSDEPWVLEGAAVRVSMIGFGGGFIGRHLDGNVVRNLNSDLTSAAADLTQARPLSENVGTAFNGVQKTGPFEVSGLRARRWLTAPQNVNGRTNADVLRPYWNGIDLARRSRDSWIVDFTGLSEAEAASYEQPFEYAADVIQPYRAGNRVANPSARRQLQTQWWLFWRPRPELRAAAASLSRVLASPEVSKHRLFAWLHPSIGIDKNLIAIVRDDDTTFGVLQSRFHELWALRLGTWLGVGNDPRYTPSTTFETFPFPEALTPNIPAADYAADPRAIAIAAAARRLNELREAWLNPPDLVVRAPEVVPGYPDRLLPKDADAERELKKRTLTRLYNERPAWLDMAHRELDAAVAAAYGWPADLADEEVLARLFALNQQRAAAGR